MEINIQAMQGICSEFEEEDAEKREVSIVIAPLKVVSNEENNRISIVTGCNMWKSCYNDGCYYSLASRLQKERREKDE